MWLGHIHAARSSTQQVLFKSRSHMLSASKWFSSIFVYFSIGLVLAFRRSIYKLHCGGCGVNSESHTCILLSRQEGNQQLMQHTVFVVLCCTVVIIEPAGKHPLASVLHAAHWAEASLTRDWRTRETSIPGTPVSPR